MAGVFVSYRREPAVEHAAGRLHADLSGEFGQETVFMDVGSLLPGENWREAIEGALSVCQVLVAVIHPGWVNDERLRDPSDVLRTEIESALQRGLAVIPALVNDAQMPRESELPEALAMLADRQAHSLQHTTWRSDIGPLLDAIRDKLPGQSRRPDEWSAEKLSDRGGRSRRLTVAVHLGEESHLIRIRDDLRGTAVKVDGEQVIQLPTRRELLQAAWRSRGQRRERLQAVWRSTPSPRWHQFQLSDGPAKRIATLRQVGVSAPRKKGRLYSISGQRQRDPYELGLWVDDRLLWSEGKVQSRTPPNPDTDADQ